METSKFIKKRIIANNNKYKLKQFKRIIILIKEIRKHLNPGYILPNLRKDLESLVKLINSTKQLLIVNKYKNYLIFVVSKNKYNIKSLDKKMLDLLIIYNNEKNKLEN